MDKIKIATLNTRGLGENIKRRKIFRYFKRFDIDLCLVQETHCDGEKESVWTNEWGNRCLFSNGNNRACDVGLLCSKKVASSIREVVRDMAGRYIIVKLCIQGCH